MAHKWEEVEATCPADLIKNVRRRCVKCGAEQERVNVGQWMRTTWQWWPLVGRCQADKRR